MNSPAAARAAAAHAVSAVYRGRSLDAALAEIFSTPSPELAGERALIQEMAYGALRWHFQLLPLLHGFLEKLFKDKDADLRPCWSSAFISFCTCASQPTPR